MQEENLHRERDDYYSNYFSYPRSFAYAQRVGGGRLIFNYGGGNGRESYCNFYYHHARSDQSAMRFRDSSFGDKTPREIILKIRLVMPK